MLLLIFCKVGYFFGEVVLFVVVVVAGFFSQLNVVLRDMLQPMSMVSL